jgi:hypothetical protein
MTTISQQVCELGQELVSPNYLSDTDYLIKNYVNSEERNLFVYMSQTGEVRDIQNEEMAQSEEGISGFSIGGAYEQKELQEEIFVSTQELIQRTGLEASDFPISEVKVVGVKESEQGKGVGSQLTATMLGELVNVTPIIAVIWNRKNNANEKIAKSYGEREEKFENYFPDDWRCRECGINSECDCSVSVYLWRP